MKNGFSDQRSAVSDQRSAVSDQRSAVSDQRSEFSDQRSAVCLLTSVLCLLISVLAAGAQTVTLEWDGNTETNLAGYRVYYGTSNRTYTVTNPVGKVTQATVTNLTLGNTYYFAVTAYTTDGLETDFSNEISYTVPEPPPEPEPLEPPGNLRIVLTLQASTNLLRWQDVGTAVFYRAEMRAEASNQKPVIRDQKSEVKAGSKRGKR